MAKSKIFTRKSGDTPFSPGNSPLETRSGCGSTPPSPDPSRNRSRGPVEPQQQPPVAGRLVSRSARRPGRGAAAARVRPRRPLTMNQPLVPQPATSDSFCDKARGPMAVPTGALRWPRRADPGPITCMLAASRGRKTSGPPLRGGSDAVSRCRAARQERSVQVRADP